jgi:hypothetical protein
MKKRPPHPATIRCSQPTREKIAKVASENRWTLTVALDVIAEAYLAMGMLTNEQHEAMKRILEKVKP